MDVKDFVNDAADRVSMASDYLHTIQDVPLEELEITKDLTTAKTLLETAVQHITAALIEVGE